jgi:Spy/CpxP family protein refolding chaperone
MNQILILLGCLAISSSFACGDLKKEDLSKDLERQQNPFLRKLNLSKDQKEQIQNLQKDHLELVYAQTQKAAAAQTDVVSAIDKNAPNEVIRERVMNFQKEKEGILSTKLDLLLATRDVLTPTQRKKASKVIKEKMQDWCN